MKAVNLAEAKARLSELVARAEGGEDVRIKRRGRPAVRLVRDDEERPKRQIDWESIDRLRESLRPDPTSSVVEMRKLDRY